MIDDLVTRGVSEPYRMFTSRAEFRLRLRVDNADQRLTSVALELGCVGSERRAASAARSRALEAGRALLDSLSLSPNRAAAHGLEINRDGRRRTAFELLAFPGVDLLRLGTIWSELSALEPAIGRQLEVDARYASYVARQAEDVAVLQREEARQIPADADFGEISGLSNEIIQKLERHRPATLAHAGRIDGMTPSALLLLLAHIRKSGRKASGRRAR
jgi:tRNA uridine 5-carboxymethylaminomethyl modification enzyme